MTQEFDSVPTIIGDLLNFNRNLVELPTKITVPHEIKIDSCPYDVVYEEDRIRMLHYKP